MAKDRKRRGRHTGSVLPHGDAWRASYCVTRDGKRVRGSKVLPTRAEAERWLRSQLDSPAAAGTVGEWLTQWLEIYKARVARKTFTSDRSTVERHIRPRLGSVRLAQLTPLRVEQFIGALKAEVTPDLRNKIPKCLRTCLNDAVRLRLIPSSPMAGIRIPGPPKAGTRSLTPAELGRVLAAADARGVGTMFRVWVEMGLRPSELIGLRWGDFDPDPVAYTIA